MKKELIELGGNMNPYFGLLAGVHLCSAENTVVGFWLLVVVATGCTLQAATGLISFALGVAIRVIESQQKGE